MSSLSKSFDSKDPNEKVVLSFDFSAELDTGETLTGTPVVTCVSTWGNDVAASSVLNGAGQFDVSNKIWLQPVQGGLDGTDYLIKVVSNTTNSLKVLALTGILPVAAG